MRNQVTSFCGIAESAVLCLTMFNMCYCNPQYMNAESSNIIAESAVLCLTMWYCNPQYRLRIPIACMRLPITGNAGSSNRYADSGLGTCKGVNHVNHLVTNSAKNYPIFRIVGIRIKRSKGKIRPPMRRNEDYVKPEEIGSSTDIFLFDFVKYCICRR